mmetsp:Transcript_18356/g.45052  ORF Transcript_18356/g.45052 Transcript_18356/m.45052 type:complete len:343 (-) Transcript_18356:2229-3257(-)
MLSSFAAVRRLLGPLRSRALLFASPRHGASSAAGAASTAGERTRRELSDGERESLRENGYLVVRGFAGKDSCEALRGRINDLIDGFDPNSSTSIFSTHEEERDLSDRYFLESGDKVRFFWEPDAFAEDGKTLQYPKRECINKVGHALHVHDSVFRGYCGTLAGVANGLGMERPLPLQSMYICKSPRTGGEVGPHQDSTFLYTDPPSVHGLWLSVDSADTDNGCLWVIPGSHATPIQKRFVRTVPFDEADTKTSGEARLQLVPFDKTMEELPKEGGVPIETEAGDLVILHGQLVHWSEKNESGKSRHALMIHVIDDAARYPKDNWLQHISGTSLKPKVFTDIS